MKKKFLSNLGYTLIEVAIAASIVGVIPITVYLEAAKHAKTASCLSNLKNIYIGLQMYEMDAGQLPDAKFYPKSPKSDPKSIANILSNYIDDRSVFICPAMPEQLKKKSLTYIWNDTYNNQFLDRVRNSSSEWVMTEMSAVDTKIPPPHHGSYNVLYFDGHVATVKEAVRLKPAKSDLKEFLKKEYFTERTGEAERLQYGGLNND